MSFGNNYRNSDIGLTALHKASETGETAVDVILATTPGFPRGKEWPLCRLHESIGNVNIYAYEAWSSINDEFSWDSLLNYGNNLVDILAKRDNSSTAAENASMRPIILMAHSLAGFIVKQCLVLVHTQKQKARYRLLRDAIAGVVFMGCPHFSPAETRPNFMKRALKILETAAERKGLRLKNTARLEQSPDLVDVCSQFHAMGGNINILTLHERMNTKVPARFKTSSLIKLVDADLAKVDSNKFEKVVEINSDHRNLPLLNDDASQGFNDSAIKHIQGLVQKAQDAGCQTQNAMPETNDDPLVDPIPLDPLIKDFVPSRPYPKVPAFLVHTSISRQRNLHFQGRETFLANLERHRLGGPHITILYGRGGLGKSELALEWAHQHEHDFDVTLWIQADDISKLRQDFGAFAAKLGLRASDTKTDPFTSRELVKKWLVQPMKSDGTGQEAIPAKWLVIFDGVGNIETLKEFEPIYGKGSILITTREPELASVFEEMASPMAKERQFTIYSMDLDLFSDAEGAAVLKKLADVNTDEDADNQAAIDIVGLVKGWPLAIRQMAGIIRHNNLTLTEFYEIYKDEDMQRDLYSNHTSARNTMIWKIRMDSLSPNATALVQVCAMLDPDCIQESLFQLESAVEDSLEGFPLTSQRLEDALDELLRLSLVQRNEKKKELWMHREDQDAVRQQCTSRIFDCAFRFAAALVKKAWQPVPERVRDNLKLWEPCAAFLRHVLHLQQIYVKGKDPDKNSTPSRVIRPSYSFAWLLHEVGCFQRGLGDSSGIGNTLVLALSICEQLPRRDTFDLLCEIYHGLGAWANETNHAQECLKYNSLYRQIWEEALRAGEPPNERTAAAWNQYGTGLTMMRRYREALKAFATSIDFYTKLELERPCPDSLPIVNSGVVKWLMGDYEGAERLLQEGLTAREEAFGFFDTESFRTGRFFHALGNLRFDQGNLEESEIWHSRALEQYMKSLGPRHHRTSDVRHRVAEHCLRRGELDKAASLIDQALESWRMDTASFKPEIARTTWLKARQVKLSGNVAAAAELESKAASLRAEILPGDQRTSKHLTDEDFDDLVAFWSR